MMNADSAIAINGLAVLAGASGFFFGALWSRIRILREKAACLTAAERAVSEFYDLAERLMADPNVPEPLKDAIYDMTLAVTDKDAGKVAFEAIIKLLEQDGPSRPSALGPILDDVRRARGDLYDDFTSAVRAAIASLMFAYGPDHSKVVVEFEATKNQSIMLNMLARIDRVISDWIASGGGRGLSRA